MRAVCFLCPYQGMAARHGSSACRLAFSMNFCASVAILSCSRNGAESPTMVGAVGDARRVDQFGKVSGETGVPDPQNEQVGCFATPANRYRFVLIGRPPLCLFFFGKPYCAMAVSTHTHTTHRIASHRSFLRIYISMCFFGFFFHRRYDFVEEHECSTSFQRRATTPEWYFDYIHTYTLTQNWSISACFGFMCHRYFQECIHHCSRNA